MSLDILVCKIVPPEQATELYTADDSLCMQIQHNRALSAIQPTGVICVEKWIRAGRNCLNDAWHRQDGELLPDESHDVPEEYERWTARHDAMRVVFPGEIGEKIEDWLISGVVQEHDSDGRYWDPDKIIEDDWDFLYISW